MKWAIGLGATLDPDLYALDVPLPFFLHCIGDDNNAKLAKHYFELRLTLWHGFRLAIYAKNGSSLARKETHDEIATIEKAMPLDLADELIVVNGDDYTRPLLTNLHCFGSSAVTAMFKRTNKFGKAHSSSLLDGKRGSALDAFAKNAIELPGQHCSGSTPLAIA